MSFLLDTNICSAHIKQRRGLLHRFIQPARQLSISTIVLGELYAWAHRREDPNELLSIIDTDFLPDLIVRDFDQACALQYGKLRSDMMRSGKTVHPTDLMIASVALVHDLTLVTNNLKHFHAIPDVRLVDWIVK